MSEEAKSDTSADKSGKNNSLDDVKERNLIFQIIITLSLIVGPIFLPFIFIFPDFFSWFPQAKIVSLIVLILFVFISIVYAKLNSK